MTNTIKTKKELLNECKTLLNTKMNKYYFLMKHSGVSVKLSKPTSWDNDYNKELFIGTITIKDKHTDKKIELGVFSELYIGTNKYNFTIATSSDDIFYSPYDKAWK